MEWELLLDFNIKKSDTKELSKFLVKNNCINIIKHILKDTNVKLSILYHILLNSISCPKRTHIFKLLFTDKRIKINNCDAVKWACNYCRNDIIKLLIRDKRTDLGISRNCAIKISSTSGNIEIVKLLLADPRVDPSDGGNGALKDAYEFFHTDVMKELLKDNRVNPSHDNNYLLRQACIDGRTSVVKLLLSHKKINLKCKSDILEQTCSRGHVKIVKILLSDTRINLCNIEDAFYKACIYGYTEIVKLLLNDKRLKLYNGNNTYVINVISEKGYTEIVKLILDDGRIDICNDNYNLSIINAYQCGHKDMLQLLLPGAKINNKNMIYAIIKFIYRGKLTECAEALLNNKNITINDKYYNKFIVKACKYNCTGIVELLVKDDRIGMFSYRNLYLCIITQYASKGGHIDIIKLLLKNQQFNLIHNVVGNTFNYNYIEVAKLLLLDPRIKVIKNIAKYVISFRHNDMIKLVLLHKGIDIRNIIITDNVKRIVSNSNKVYNNDYGNENNKVINRTGLFDLIIKVE